LLELMGDARPRRAGLRRRKPGALADPHHVLEHHAGGMGGMFTVG
jgi:hypothetical protein